MRRITSLYSKATATRERSNAAVGSNVAEGSRKRPRGRPRGRGKGGDKTRPPSPIPSSPSELPSTHSSFEEEEVQVEEEAGVEEEAEVEEEAGMEEEIGGTSSSTSSRVWLRGPSTLLRRPIPLERRPLIRPDGDK